MLKKKYTFIDMFAGIGGFHQAMHSVGVKYMLDNRRITIVGEDRLCYIVQSEAANTYIISSEL